MNHLRPILWLTCFLALDWADPVAAPAAEPAKQFQLQVVVDFYDDLLAAPFSQKTLDAMMDTFARWGITRVYFNGQAYASGLYDAASNRGLDANALRSYEQLGEFIPAFVKAAHRRGIELYIEFKPLDMYFPLTVPHGGPSLFRDPHASRKGIPVLGGSWQFGSIFPEQHPELLMARNRVGLREGIEREPIGAIQLVKQDAAPTALTRENLEIFVSSDNLHYRRYEKPYQFEDRVVERPVMLKGVNLNRPDAQTEQVRVIRLSGLAIGEPYVALSTQKKTGDPQFGNLYYRLVELYSVGGEPMPFTYGIPGPIADQWYPPELEKERFPQRGFNFDFSPELPANNVSFRGIDSVGYADPPSGLLGLAKGKNPYLSALCPAYPEVRRYWLDQVQQFIDWEVDGVEFRWAAHQTSMELDAYGFNPPIVEEYRKRYGVDILHEDFDRAKWVQLRGEYYTQFYREAKALLAKHGKKMMVDVMPSNEADPARSQFLDVHLDWPAWFAVADGVSFKWVAPDTPADAAFRQVAQQYGIPTYYNVWPQIVYKDWDKARIADGLRGLQAAGHQGFMLYESAGLMRANADGTFQILYPEVAEAIAPAVRAMNGQ